MSPQDEDRDEQQIASFLGALEKDAAPPDPAFWTGLREQSTQAFQETIARQAPRPTRGRFMISGTPARVGGVGGGPARLGSRPLLHALRRRVEPWRWHCARQPSPVPSRFI